MLSDAEYVKQKILIDLFYLRTLRRFATNLKLAFLPKDEKLANQAESFAYRSITLEYELLKYADYNIPLEALSSDIIITKYTEKLEEQAIRLMDIPIEIGITKKEKALKSGEPSNPTPELINALNEINHKALVLINDFLKFTDSLLTLEITNKQFTYADPFLISYMIEQIKTYEAILKRLLERQKTDEKFTQDYIYRNNQTMRNIAILIRSYIGPSRDDLFIKAESFVKQYDQLLLKYQESNNKKDLTKISQILSHNFAIFVEKIIQELLEFKAYFIMEPTLLDNMLTDINFFKYNLRL